MGKKNIFDEGKRFGLVYAVKTGAKPGKKRTNG
jgi:hypothetical protein